MSMEIDMQNKFSWKEKLIQKYLDHECNAFEKRLAVFILSRDKELSLFAEQTQTLKRDVGDCMFSIDKSFGSSSDCDLWSQINRAIDMEGGRYRVEKGSSEVNSVFQASLWAKVSSYLNAPTIGIGATVATALVVVAVLGYDNFSYEKGALSKSPMVARENTQLREMTEVDAGRVNVAQNLGDRSGGSNSLLTKAEDDQKVLDSSDFGGKTFAKEDPFRRGIAPDLVANELYAAAQKDRRQPLVFYSGRVPEALSVNSSGSGVGISGFSSWGPPHESMSFQGQNQYDLRDEH